MTSAELTVVVACHDERRWDHLAAALASVREQGVKCAIVVGVDHNRPLAERICATWPDITVVENRFERGASGVRNTGAEACTTEFIAFLDDDAAAHPNWLSRLLEPFGDPDVVGTGGGVAPVWACGERPRWFPEEFDWAIGASFLGMPVGRAQVRNVWSENMAVRRDVFEAVGGFRLGFGKVGHRSRPEDTDLCIRMAQHRPRGHWIYVPDAVADHHVPVARSTYRFFLRRSYLEGRGKIEMAELLGDQASRLGDEHAYLTRVLPRGLARGVRDALRGNPDGLLRAGAISSGAVAAALGASAALNDRWIRRVRGASLV